MAERAPDTAEIPAVDTLAQRAAQVVRDGRAFIGGKRLEPEGDARFDVISPMDGAVVATLPDAGAREVDAAVAAARAAFADGRWRNLAASARAKVLQRFATRVAEDAETLGLLDTLQMGKPAAHAIAGAREAAEGLEVCAAQIETLGDQIVPSAPGSLFLQARRPRGVVAAITPWNYPVQVALSKVGPALAMGNSVVLKPSEIAPFSGYLFAEILHDAGVPAGVFNLVNGDGPTVGAALAAHPGVDMVSFTGSTRAGIEVAKNAAPTVKRVHQELGGKSPNIILDDADFKAAVSGGVKQVMLNSGQSCNAPTRMLVPHAKMADAMAIAKEAAESTTVGDPGGNAFIGPVVSDVQWTKIQALIQRGIEEGATLVAGGTGKPEGLEKGYYVKPTVFGEVTNSMTIAREEIFGPVVAILGYKDVDDAVAIANDTPYGLSGYVSSSSLERARQVAKRIRAGQVHINGAGGDFMAPFGGYKQSGNGREWGDHAFHEFLEVKAVLGFGAQAAE